jgi:hypothetical protein
MKYSKNEIINLYNQFQQLYKYKERIAFYDRHFGILPFDFPFFDEKLPILFDDAVVQELKRIRDMEKLNTVNTKDPNTKISNTKVFTFKKSLYTFSVKPNTGVAKHYNEFILLKFITVNLSHSQQLKDTSYLFFSQQNEIKIMYCNAMKNLERIDEKLYKRYDTSIERSFLKVFMQGVIDFNNKSLKISKTKRKFIELYLYAQGILFAQYIQMLERLMELNKNEQIG